MNIFIHRILNIFHFYRNSLVPNKKCSKDVKNTECLSYGQVNIRDEVKIWRNIECLSYGQANIYLLLLFLSH